MEDSKRRGIENELDELIERLVYNLDLTEEEVQEAIRRYLS